MNVALKEWASVVEALSSGRQILLLRKGGLAEARRGGFALRRREFLLFPTFEHQHRQWLKPQVVVKEPNSGLLRISVLAEVSDVIENPSREGLRRLFEEHVWNEDFISMRCAYRPDLPLQLLVVRVARLATVWEIPDRPSYRGCKSWVYLSEEVDVEGTTLVLPDAEFEARRQKILETVRTFTD
jgi:hypothetical protein